MENITEAEKYQLFQDVIGRYVGLWVDVRYISMEMPIGITIQKIHHSADDIRESLYANNFALMYQQLVDFDFLMEYIISNDRCNLEIIYDTFMAYLTTPQRNEIENCGSYDVEYRFQKVLNILFEDYYSLRRMYGLAQ
jgi:hypothetical protein